MVKYIKRRTEQNIYNDLGQFPVVGIIGPRQVGKTTLARSISENMDKPCHYLDLELPSDIAKLENAEFYFSQHDNECIILDEIQVKPELFPVLRGMVDKNRTPGRFIILGSASPTLIRKGSDSLAGRIAYTELAPFNILEIHYEKDIYEHWFLGGFPGALFFENEAEPKRWIHSFVQTYAEKDLQLLGMPASPGNIKKLLTMVANYQGGIWNASNFAKSMGLTYATINRYVDFLEEAFLITRLHAFHFNIKKRLVKSPKIYIRDSGILHYLASIPDFEQLQGNVLIGNSWEGYVIEQIRQILPDETDMYYYRTHNGAEADIVLVRGLKPVSAIEIKFSSSPLVSKGFHIAIDDLGTKENYIITPSSEDYLKTKNIRVCNLTDYLSEYL